MAGRSQPGLGFWSRKAPGLEVALGARAMPGQCWQSRASERYSRLTNRQGYTRQGRETMRAGKVYSYFGKNCKSRCWTCATPSLPDPWHCCVRQQIM